jgi:hypothetical protein
MEEDQKGKPKRKSAQKSKKGRPRARRTPASFELAGRITIRRKPKPRARLWVLGATLISILVMIVPAFLPVGVKSTVKTPLGPWIIETVPSAYNSAPIRVEKGWRWGTRDSPP